jgi:hypothetical protein
MYLLSCFPNIYHNAPSHCPISHLPCGCFSQGLPP